MNNASQSCQNFSCHLEISEQKKNDRLISKNNLSKYEKEKDVLKDSNIALQKWVMVEGKVASMNVKNF